MPITSGWYDSIDKIYYPEDYARWDDVGNGANHYHTITAVNSPTINSNGITFGESSTAYVKLAHTSSLDLQSKDNWTIEFGINILTDSTSTTNFQTSNVGLVIAQGEGDDSVSNVSTGFNWAIYVDANNQINFSYRKADSSGTVFNITAASVKLFNDQNQKVKITWDGSELKFYIDNDFKFTHIPDSIGMMAVDTTDLVIGGNSTGNFQLYNTRIGPIRIRKDEFTGDAFASSSDRLLIEAARQAPSTSAVTSDNWDINTLLYLTFEDGDTKPRQLKKIPGTWGDYTRWFILPKDHIDVTTGTINFDQKRRGFKKVSVTTTDGWLLPYKAGRSEADPIQTAPHWGGTHSYSSDPDTSLPLHQQGGDLNFSTLKFAGHLQDTTGNYKAKVISTDSTNFRLVCPSKGYMPLTEETESQSMLDTTKVDSVSANAQYNQGFRPRGIKKILYELSEEFIEDEVTANADDHVPMMGMPYFEEPSQGLEGGKYISGNHSSGALCDTDFRYNEEVSHIKQIQADSTGQAEITTRSAHGLTTGDRVFVRPGQEFIASTNYLKRHSLSTSRHYMVITGKKYVRVIDTDKVLLFHDSARSNPVIISNGNQLFEFKQGYLQKATDLGLGIQQNTNLRRFNYTMPNTSTYHAFHRGTGISNFIQFTTVANHHGFNTPGGASNYLTPDINLFYPNLNLPNTEAPLETGDLNDDLFTYTFKDVPAGTSADPFVINSISGGFTSNSIGEEGAPMYIDIDTRYKGTLKINLSNVETADSTTPTDVKYQYIVNGEAATTAQPFNSSYNAWGSQFYDTNQTINTVSFGSTIEIPVDFPSGESPDQNNKKLISVAVKVWIPDVVHSATADRTRATYTIHYENTDSNVPVRLFYGSGQQPGKTVREEMSTSGRFSDDAYIYRSRHYITYQANETRQEPNPEVTLGIRGIPFIGYTALGDTAYALDKVSDGANSVNYASGANLIELPYMSETTSNVNFTPAPPWVSETIQTKGQYRLYRGQYYECEVTHTASKTFEEDIAQGRWTPN